MSEGVLILHPRAGVAVESSIFDRVDAVATTLDAWWALLGDNYLRQSALAAIPRICPMLREKIPGEFVVDSFHDGHVAAIEASFGKPFRRDFVDHPCDFLRETTLVYQL